MGTPGLTVLLLTLAFFLGFFSAGLLSESKSKPAMHPEVRLLPPKGLPSAVLPIGVVEGAVGVLFAFLSKTASLADTA